MLLTDLPQDALASVLVRLGPRGLAVAACTNWTLYAAATLDSLWQRHCENWRAAQPSTAGLGGVGVADLQAALGVNGGRELYKVLHQLGAWPAGLWYLSASDGWGWPRGRLLVVGQDGPTLTGSLVWTEHAHGPPIDQKALFKLGAWFTIHLEPPGGIEVPAPNVNWHHIDHAGGTLAIVQDGGELSVHMGSSVEQVPATPGVRLLPDFGGQPEGLRVPETVRFSRLPLQPAGTGPAAGAEAGGAGILKGLEGMYTACYGPHGMEVLLLRLGLPEDPPPPGCPIAGPRLEALKIAGDPNVPALKHSFVIDATQCQLGGYDPQADDPFAQPGGFARPVLSFYESATLVLHLEQRPARARFHGVGQINQVPGVWDPEWVAATLVVYEPGYRLPFTLIFEDEGAQVRHGLDFQPLAISSPGFNCGGGM